MSLAIRTSARTKWMPAFGFIVSALAVGVPYFLVPYRELNLPTALYGPGLYVVVAAAALTAGLWSAAVDQASCRSFV